MKGQNPCFTGCFRSPALYSGMISFLKNMSPRKEGFFLDGIRYYQKNVSHSAIECTFTPSCSHYARQAILKYGSALGVIKGAFRILRCNPLTGGGYDPA